jgi:hypothetical protein
VVKLLKKNSQSDVTLASLDDVSRAKKLPCVTQICDLHVPEMPNQLDTCHCLIAPCVLADMVYHVSLLTCLADMVCHMSLRMRFADIDLPDLTVIV